MKTKATKTLLVIAGMAVLAFTACEKKKDKPAPPASTTGGSTTGQANQGEVITHFELTLTSMNGTVSTSNTYKYIDNDGDGGQPAFFGGTNQSDSVITLIANKTYSASIKLFDRSKTPVDTISNEVQAEGADHMFFFNQSNPSNVSSVWSTTFNTFSNKNHVCRFRWSDNTSSYWFRISMANLCYKFYKVSCYNYFASST